MKELPAGYVEVSKGVYERIDVIKKRAVGGKAILPAKSSSRNSKPKPPVLNGSVGEVGGEAPHTGRILIRVKTRRSRAIDPDNNCCKWIIDCLRYSGILQNDREQDVALEISQEKTRGEEETLIELFRDTKAIR
jgi:hypothetical protein